MQKAPTDKWIFPAANTRGAVKYKEKKIFECFLKIIFLEMKGNNLWVALTM
jgi:hypothetical protein